MYYIIIYFIILTGSHNYEMRHYTFSLHTVQ